MLFAGCRGADAERGGGRAVHQQGHSVIPAHEPYDIYVWIHVMLRHSPTFSFTNARTSNDGRVASTAAGERWRVIPMHTLCLSGVRVGGRSSRDL